MGDNNEQAKHEVGKLFSSFLPNHMMHMHVVLVRRNGLIYCRGLMYVV